MTKEKITLWAVKMRLDGSTEVEVNLVTEWLRYGHDKHKLATCSVHDAMTLSAASTTGEPVRVRFEGQRLEDLKKLLST